MGTPERYGCCGSLPLVLNACGSGGFLKGSLGAPDAPRNWLMCRLRKDSMGEPGVSNFSGVLGGNGCCTACGS